MSNKVRGSDQLKMHCPDYEVLTQDEISQVAGGALLSSYVVFPKGIPWPELFSKAQFGNDPVAQLGSLSQMAKF